MNQILTRKPADSLNKVNTHTRDLGWRKPAFANHVGQPPAFNPFFREAKPPRVVDFDSEKTPWAASRKDWHINLLQNCNLTLHPCSLHTYVDASLLVEYFLGRECNQLQGNDLSFNRRPIDCLLSARLNKLSEI